VTTTLTERQRQVLDFVGGTISEHGTSPTYREITAEFGFRSPKAAVDHIESLARKGYVRIHRGRSRGIELLVAKDQTTEGTVSIPVRGTVAAGKAIDETETPSGQLQVDRTMVGRVHCDRLFALRVSGDSMTGRGIQDGDIVVAESGSTPQTGDVVVALIDQENSLKTLAHGPNGMFLRAENPRYPDLFPVAQLTIQGVVRTLIRKVG
jgi:repressor LexA